MQLTRGGNFRGAAPWVKNVQMEANLGATNRAANCNSATVGGRATPAQSAPPEPPTPPQSNQVAYSTKPAANHFSICDSHLREEIALTKSICHPDTDKRLQ